MGGGDNEIVISAVLDAVGFQKGSQQLEKAVRGISASAKRLAGTIIGVSSAYQILSRAVSAYMSENQKLAAQMNSIWTALGNVLGPIINQIISWVTTAVSYFLEFLRVLGLTAKTASQLSKKASGAGSELKKTLAGFDELNLLNEGGGGGGANGTLSDVDLDGWVKNLIELIKGKMWDDAADIIIRKFNGLIAVFKTQAEKLGKKIGEYFGGIVHIIARVLDETRWAGIGEGIGAFLMGLTDDLDGEDLGKILISKITIAFDILVGFLSTNGLGDRIATLFADTFIGAFNSLADHIARADWRKIGENIIAFFEKLWAKKDEIALAIFNVVSAAWNAFLDMLRGLMSSDDGEDPPLIGALVKLGRSVEEFAESLKKVWDEKIEPTLSALFNWTINQGLPEFFDSLAGVISKLAKVVSGEIDLTKFVADLDGLEAVLVALAAIKTISGLLGMVESMTAAAAVFPTIAPLVATLGALAIAIKHAADVSDNARKVGFVEPGLAAEEYAQNVAVVQEEYDQLIDVMRAYGPEAANDAVLMDEQIEKASALANAKQQLADALGLTVEELNAQIEAANGDVTQIEALTQATAKLGDAYEESAVRVNEAVEAHTSAIREISDTTDEVGMNVERVVSEMGTNYEESAKRMKAATDEHKAALEEIPVATKGVGQDFGEDIGQMVESAETGFGDVAKAFEQSKTDMLDQTQEMSAGVVSGTEEMHTLVVGEVQEMSDEMVWAFQSSSSGLANAATEAVYGVGDVMSSGMGSLAGGAYVWGADMMVALSRGIAAAFSGTVRPTIAQIAQSIRDYLGFSEPKEGPLSDFHTYGPDMMKLYAEGIESNKTKVLNAVGDVAGDVSDALAKGEFDIGKAKVSDFEGSMDSFADKIVEGFADLISRLEAIADNVTFTMPNFAGGGIVPYGVSGNGSNGVPDMGNGDTSGLVNELIGLVEDFRKSVDSMQWVLQFGNTRAIVQEITKIQKQEERARG